VDVCRKRDVRFSITVRLHRRLEAAIAALPRRPGLHPLFPARAGVAETTTPLRGKGIPVRLIVRRVPPTPGSQLALFTPYTYHAFISDRKGDTLTLEADHRRHAEIENTVRDLKYGVGLNHLPSGKFAANAAWIALQVLAHNLGVWVNRLGLQGAPLRTKTLRHRYLALAVGSPIPPGVCFSRCLPAAPWREEFMAALTRLALVAASYLTTKDAISITRREDKTGFSLPAGGHHNARTALGDVRAFSSHRSRPDEVVVRLPRGRLKPFWLVARGWEERTVDSG